jgi:hypothetical protein
MQICGHMFQPPLVILRPLKYIKIKITIATSVMGGQINISIFSVTKCTSLKLLKTNETYSIYW